MTAALVCFDKKKGRKTRSFLENIQITAASRCSTLHILDGYALSETDRLHMYEYIAVFYAEKGFFTAKHNTALIALLKEHGLKEGCKGCVLTVARGFFSQKHTRNIMNDLERYGFIIDYCAALKNTVDARRAGENIG